MSDTKTEKKHELNSKSLNISERLQAALTVDDTGRLAGDTATADAVYSKTLPEGVTDEIVNLVKEHDHDMVAGTMHAVGMLTVGALKKHPDLKTVSGSIKGAKHEKFEVVATPYMTGAKPGTTTGEVYEKYGKVVVNHMTTSGSKGGQIGAAMGLVQEATMLALKKSK